jgi:hypothetical protein
VPGQAGSEAAEALGIVELREIVTGLERFHGFFPRQELTEALARREEVTPHLIGIVERCTAELRSGPGEGNDGLWPVPALMLLAQFREERALPALLDLLSLKENLLDAALSDFITEDLPAVLASLSGSRTDHLEAAVLDTALYEYVRSGALHAMANMVCVGTLERDRFVAFCAGLFRGGLEREQSSVWGLLLNACCDLQVVELQDEVRQAMRENLVPEFWMNEEDVDEAFALSGEEARARLKGTGHGLIDNAIASLAGWACFHEKDEEARQALKDILGEEDGEDDSDFPEDDASETEAEDDEYPEQLVRDEPKVGRNDPCPCGSGNKYKRCCGR